jgi:hypothetical protein
MCKGHYLVQDEQGVCVWIVLNSCAEHSEQGVLWMRGHNVWGSSWVVWESKRQVIPHPMVSFLFFSGCLILSQAYTVS